MISVRSVGAAVVAMGALGAVTCASAARLDVPVAPLLVAQGGDAAQQSASGEGEAETPQIGLTVPETTTIGNELTVEWSGPGTYGDEIQLFDSEEGENGSVFSFERITEDNGGTSVTLTVPAKPGTYQVRYVDGKTGTVMSAAPLKVELIEVLLEAPQTITAGETFEVHWTGPGAARDRVELFDPSDNDAGHVIDSRRVVEGNFGARTVELTAPEEPGTYSLRYVSIDSDIVLHEMSIEVAAAAETDTEEGEN